MQNEVELEAEYQLMVSVEDYGQEPRLDCIEPKHSEYLENLFNSGAILRGIDLHRIGDYLVDVDLYEDGSFKVVGVFYNEGWVMFEY